MQTLTNQVRLGCSSSSSGSIAARVGSLMRGPRIPLGETAFSSLLPLLTPHIHPNPLLVSLLELAGGHSSIGLDRLLSSLQRPGSFPFLSSISSDCSVSDSRHSQVTFSSPTSSSSAHRLDPPRTSPSSDSSPRPRILPPQAFLPLLCRLLPSSSTRPPFFPSP